MVTYTYKPSTAKLSNGNVIAPNGLFRSTAHMPKLTPQITSTCLRLGRKEMVRFQEPA